MLDKSSYVPLSRQVFDIICNRIVDGIYPKEKLLPSQESFSKEFDVSMITVRQAFNDLNQKKIIISKRGIGSVVIKIPEIYQGKHTAHGFTVDSKVQEYSLKSENIKIHQDYKYAEASYNLGIGNLNPIFINRIRYINNKKVSLEFSSLNSILLNKTDWRSEFLDNMSLYSFIFNKYSYQIIKAEEKIMPVISEKKIREQLDLKKTIPVFFIKRLTYIEHKKNPIEYCEYYILPEYYGKIIYSVTNNKKPSK